MPGEESGQLSNVRIVDADGIKATVRNLAANDALNVALVDSSGNQITTFGGVSVTDDSPFTPASSSVNVAGFVFDDVAPDSVDEGDAGAARMSANRNQYVTIRDAASNERGVNVTAGNALVTDGSAVTQPVSLASVPSHPVTNAGTFAVQESGAALTALQKIDNLAHSGSDVALVEHVPISGQLDDVATTAVTENQIAPVRISSRRALLVEGVASGTVIPVSDGAGSLTVDNAGTFATQVDGAALTALQLIDNLVLLEDAAHVTADPGIQMLAIRDDTLNIRSGAENDYEPLHTDANGALWVRHTSDAVTVASHAVTNAGTFAVQESGAALTALQLIDDTVFAEDVAATAADKGIQVLAVRRDADTTLVGTDNDYAPLQVNANGALKVEAFSGETLPVSGTVTANLAAGTNNIGDMDILSIAAGSNLIGDVGLQPRTSGGLSFYKTIDLDETEEEVKATAGQVYGLHVMNLTAALLYFKIYNAIAANVTVGTTTPDITIPVPGNNDSDGGGFTWSIPQGVAFGTAITVACTTGIADNDSGAPAANACVATVLYK